MKPSSFENAIRLQFDCLARKVIGRTVKNYNKELARRAKHEISFCEIPELELNQLGVSDEYPIEFTSFDVFGTEVRVYDEKLCEAIKKLSERRRNVVLMFYFLELPDAEIAEILDISRNSVYRNNLFGKLQCFCIYISQKYNLLLRTSVRFHELLQQALLLFRDKGSRLCQIQLQLFPFQQRA